MKPRGDELTQPRRFTCLMRNMGLSFASVILVALAGCAKSDAPVPGESANPHSVSIAAASDLQFALPGIVAEFQKAYPDIDIKATFGSSGNFFAQLTHKAPFDVYLSADIGYPQKLIDKELADKNSLFLYAVGELVIWVPKDSPLDIEGKGVSALLDDHVQKVAIANPAHAPYGRAAVAALQSIGVYEAVEKKLVAAENVAQAAQFVESGSAQVGLLAHSIASSAAMKEKGRFVAVPRDSHPPIEQAGIILSWAKDKEAAEKFRTYLKEGPGRDMLAKAGFQLPGK